MTVRALELFSGIGGFSAAALGTNLMVVGALDQNPAAQQVYRLNFPDHEARQVDIERLGAWELVRKTADFWWLSPPCQPYCERGARRDLDDPRARSLLRLLELLAAIPDERLPESLALENVAGFASSRARDGLLDLLGRRCYHIREQFICPTDLGIPSRRPRYYLAASRTPLAPPEPLSVYPLQLAQYLDAFKEAEVPASLSVAPDILARFGPGLRILDPADPAAYTTCFTSGYGKSVVNSGSYLRCGEGVRYFSPEEVARLLHFPSWFRFPDEMPLRKRWHLIGNSLSIAAVREVLKALPAIRFEPRAEVRSTVGAAGQ